MEPKYPTLKRPKRKLCYVDVANKESPSKQWFAQLSMGDVDKIFDGIDPSLHYDDVDLLDPTPLSQSSDADLEKEAPTRSQQEGHLVQTISSYQKGLKEDALHSTARSRSPVKDIVADLDLQFKDHGPVKTSSPIEENMIVKGAKEAVIEKHRTISPILFACEDEGKEEAEMEPGPSQKLQCDGDIIKHFDDFELESPPSKITLCKPKTPSHKNNVDGSCKNNHPVQEQAPRKQITADMDGKRKVIRKQNTDPPVTDVRQEPGVAAPEKKSEGATSQVPLKPTRVEKDMTTFLQKLREASQPKPSCVRKSLSPVKVPTPPETDDDFCILEDDTPLWISIPRKTATIKKHRQTCSSGKDSSSDQGAKDGSTETAQKQHESEPANDNMGCQDVDQKIMLKEGENNEMIESGCDMNEFCSPDQEPAEDLKEQEKPNKKKRLKKVPSNESDMAEDQPEARRKMDKRKNTQKSSDRKRSKSLKGTSENAKASKIKSLKEATKQTQVSDAAKRTGNVEAVNEQHQELSSEEHADAETGASPSDKEILTSEAQMFVKDTQNEQTVKSGERSSEGSQTSVKRKRRITGQWWLNRSQTTEETKVTVKLPTRKKSKQSSKETGPLPAETKKDKVFKKRELMPPAPSSSQKTTKAKEKKTKQKRNRKEDRPDTMKTRKGLDEVEPEPIEEQQKENLDQDPCLLHFSPLNLSKRHHSCNAEHGVFQKVYHNIPKEKMYVTPAWEFPSGSKEQLRAAEPEKRRRKPPSDWWLVTGMSEEVQSISSQAQQQEPKPHKQRKQPKQRKSPGLGAPEIGNMALSQKPAGESPITRRRTSSMSKSLRSGPSSMIVPRQYEENDESILPSTRVSAVLSTSDICGPPLKPLILQPKDKANLKEWFKCLWSTTADKGPEITPDQFDWYFHRGRAIGFLFDINCGYICNGKMLLGSYMKKPLWVDHSATTVFNLSTSSVSVIMNSFKSRYNPGQSFMVSCGHAYSIENITAEPALLYFTRIFVESSD